MWPDWRFSSDGGAEVPSHLLIGAIIESSIGFVREWNQTCIVESVLKPHLRINIHKIHPCGQPPPPDICIDAAGRLRRRTHSFA
jgi:hypothetical protein